MQSAKGLIHRTAELSVCSPPLLKQRQGRGWRDQREGGAEDMLGYKDGGGGGFCSAIVGLAPSELDIKSPCQVFPTLKGT